MDYLYGPNKVRLPELPTWNSVAAPEAIIVKTTSGTEKTYFYCGIDMLTVRKATTAITSEPTVKYVLTDGRWEPTDYWLGAFLTSSGLIWANYDVYYSEKEDDAALAGTLYLAASDPVPVSPVTLNPADVVQGYFVGMAVKRSRK